MNTATVRIEAVVPEEELDYDDLDVEGEYDINYDPEEEVEEIDGESPEETRILNAVHETVAMQPENFNVIIVVV